jgi:outer membrane protein assembly factor BamD
MAAESSALTFMEDYPMSEFKEEVHYLLVLNSYFLAKNSIEKKKKARIEQTIERYSTFVAAFPESKYVRMLASYDDVMRKDLKEY